VSAYPSPGFGRRPPPAELEPLSSRASESGRREPKGIVRGLLRMPLFYKILIANSGIVLLGAVLGTLAIIEFIRLEPGHSPAELVFGLALAGVGLTVMVNAIILRLALRPLKQLEATAARVQEGDMAARTPLSPLADRELERLARTFNAMLDATAAYRQRVRDVAAHALNAEEEERKRVARELHDETAQTLAALLIRLRLGRGITEPGAREAFLEEMRQEIADALEGVRRFARGLRPPSLDELGLVPALEAHVRGLSESMGIPIRLEADPVDGVLHSQGELVLYRIVQEALSNAVRHAEPDRVHVRITRGSDTVTVSVEDDGRGFVLEEVINRNGQGLGLYGMEERAAYLGGRVQIQSRPGVGTRVEAEIPIADRHPYAAEHQDPAR
jgi:two-component system, NarL family, sensor histidine kinase UhpB